MYRRAPVGVGTGVLKSLVLLLLLLLQSVEEREIEIEKQKERIRSDFTLSHLSLFTDTFFIVNKWLLERGRDRYLSGLVKFRACTKYLGQNWTINFMSWARSRRNVGEIVNHGRPYWPCSIMAVGSERVMLTDKTRKKGVH